MDYQNIMKELLNPSHKPSRSGKDLTHRKILSAKAGQLLPILCEEMVPNDYFEVDTASLLRTFPLRTAAFIRAKVHMDFFFVPKTAIWRNWDRFYSQRNDHETNYIKSFAYEPNITLEQIQQECSTTRYVAGSALLNSQQHRAKIAQLLGYSKIGYYAASDFASGGDFYSIKDKSLTILPAMGYQRIYNFHYRNAWRDEPDSYAANLYSADSWDCSTYANSLLNANFPYTNVNQESIFTMRYHGWYSDLFMGSLPNQQFGSVSTIDVSGRSIVSDVTGNPLSNTPRVLSVDSTSKLSASSVSTDGVIPAQWSNVDTRIVSQFDVLALRKALALQKWKEYNMRAGWKSRNQARAMFGVSTPEDRKHEIEFIKGYEFPLMVDEVISQNGASGGNLAEIAGKGIGVGNGEKLTFNSGERHGYLYCIAYIMPQAEYDAIGIEKYLVRSEPFDHYVSAFENLGMEPIYKYELNATGNPTQFDAVIGYVPRYHEYKTRVDKVYGQFMAGNTLDSWVSVRRDLQAAANTGYIPTSLFYVNPAVLDSVFGFSVNGSEVTDQFMLNVNISDHAVRPMSDLGLPTL